MKPTLMLHIVGGYPSLVASEKLAKAMLASGVKFLEIQIPFSDPVADGSTIMAANQVALAQGTTPDDCLALLGRITAVTTTPILLMTYYNIVFRYGLERFCQRAKARGCYGFIIPDVPIDEEPYEHYLALCKKYQLHAIQVISPITPICRLKKIGQVASGFVYCVANLGTTGEQRNMYPQLQTYLRRVQRYVKVPLAVGFGISTKAQVDEVIALADIVVIGSKIINVYNTATSTKKITAVKKCIKALQ